MKPHIFLAFDGVKFTRLESVPEAFDAETVYTLNEDSFPECDGYEVMQEVAADEAAAEADCYAYRHPTRGSYWVYASVDDVVYWVCCDHAFDFYRFWCGEILKLPQVIDILDRDDADYSLTEPGGDEQAAD